MALRLGLRVVRGDVAGLSLRRDGSTRRCLFLGFEIRACSSLLNQVSCQALAVAVRSGSSLVLSKILQTLVEGWTDQVQYSFKPCRQQRSVSVHELNRNPLDFVYVHIGKH